MTSTSPFKEDVLDQPDIDFDKPLKELDAHCAALAPGLIENYCFVLNGIPFELRRMGPEGAYRYVIAAFPGYAPFTIESAQRRFAVKDIARATRTLRSKITISALISDRPVKAPDFMFYPLMCFLQEAYPFMRLLRDYL
jgi:hypothetical protein